MRRTNLRICDLSYFRLAGYRSGRRVDRPAPRIPV